MYDIYLRDADGRHLVETNANYRLVELYREQCSNIEAFDVGADPYEESRAKRVNRGRESQLEAKMIAHRDFMLAMTDYCGSF